MEGPDWQNKDKEMETAVRGSLENGPSTSSTRLHLVMLEALNGRRTSISLSMPSISTSRRITASPPSAFLMGGDGEMETVSTGLVIPVTLPMAAFM